MRRSGVAAEASEWVPAKGWEVVDAYGLLIELDSGTAFLKVPA